MDIGFIGLGNMGGPMAANLVASGQNVKGYDLSSEACEVAHARGVTAVGTPSECCEAVDLIITMLPAGEHVRSVMQEVIFPAVEASGAQPVLIDCSTIDVTTARQIAALAEERGLSMLDAPVSGGVSGAEAGTLAFMIGGPESAVEIARPLFDVMGAKAVHVGSAGAGQAAKMCNNMMLAIQMISVCEGFALAERLGIDWQKQFDVSANASAQCWSLTTYCPVPGPVPTSRANQGYTPGFSNALMHKDLGLAMQAAQDVEAHVPLGQLAMQMYQELVTSGHGGRDFSSILELVRGSLPDGSEIKS